MLVLSLLGGTLGAQGGTSTSRHPSVPDSLVSDRLSVVTYQRAAHSAVITHTPAEWGYRVFLMRREALVSRQPDAPFAKDSIRAALHQQVRAWVASLEQTPPHGLQVDAYGDLLASGAMDSAARAVFCTRLATPGMTTTDSALTLIAAVRAFADADDAARLRIADDYMTQLDTLGVAANVWKATGHQLLAYVNFLAGDSAGMTTHAMRTVERLPRLFFKSRVNALTDANTYLSLVDMLRRTPAGKRQLDSLNQRLLAAALPEQALVAQDSSFEWTGQWARGLVQRTVSLGTMLGNPAPDIVGTSWINVADTGSHAMSLHDGIIRIVGLGSRRTTLFALPAFQRILGSPGIAGHNVQAVYHVSTEGYWGTQPMSPAEETAKLVTYFTKTRPTTVPVAIWAGEKEPLYDGRVHPRTSPTLTAFRVVVGAQSYAIVDRDGRVRRIFLGPFGPDEEAVATAVIRHLVNEPSPTVSSE